MDINSNVNAQSKFVGIHHNLGKSKKKLPHQQEKKKTFLPAKRTNSQIEKSGEKHVIDDLSNHQRAKVEAMMLAVVVGGFLFYKY